MKKQIDLSRSISLAMQLVYQAATSLYGIITLNEVNISLEPTETIELGENEKHYWKTINISSYINHFSGASQPYFSCEFYKEKEGMDWMPDRLTIWSKENKQGKSILFFIYKDSANQFFTVKRSDLKPNF